MSSEQNAMVPFDDRQAGAAENLPVPITGPMSINQWFGAESDIAISNFDGDAMQQWRLTALATGPDCGSYDTQPPEGMFVRYWYASRWERVDEKTREVSEAIRVAFISPDGRAWAFSSNGIVQDLRRLISTFGAKPFDPPLQCRVVSSKTTKGYRVYRLQPVT